MVELIILDCYGTIIKADSADNVVRPGLDEFLEYYQRKNIVVFSDGEIDALKHDLNLPIPLVCSPVVKPA